MVNLGHMRIASIAEPYLLNGRASRVTRILKHRSGWDELSEAIVKNYVRVLIHPFSDEAAWPEPRLKELTKIGPGEWRAGIASPYLD